MNPRKIYRNALVSLNGSARKWKKIIWGMTIQG
jgi:hypothetical protein